MKSARFLPVAALLLSAAVSTWSLGRHFEGALTHEFCNYAEIGRNLVEGRGLKTAMVYPFTLAVLDERGELFDGLAPVLDRFPLHAALNALALVAGGEGDGGPAALSALLLGLLAAATAAAGLLLFGPVEAALAAAFVALNPSFQRAFVLWGQPDFGFAALVLALTLLVVLAKERGRGTWAAAGALAALAWLQRSNLLLWLPLFALWLARGKGGPRRLAWFAGAGALAAAPAILYYLAAWGSVSPPTVAWNLPHHVIVDTPPWLHYRVFSSWETLAYHAPALGRKVARYLWLQVAGLPGWWQMTLIFPAALAGGWLLRSKIGPARDWAALVGLMLALQLVAFSFLRFEVLGPWVGGRYYLWAAPALFLLAAHAAVAFGKRLGRPALVPALFAAANAALFARGLAAAQGAPAYPGGLHAADWPELAAVARVVGPGGLVASNLPGQVVWYARRPAVALPAEPEDLLRIDENHPIDALLLSRLPLGELANTPAWRPLLADPKALMDFAAKRRWALVRDFGTSVLFAR